MITKFLTFLNINFFTNDYFLFFNFSILSLFLNFCYYLFIIIFLFLIVSLTSKAGKTGRIIRDAVITAGAGSTFYANMPSRPPRRNAEDEQKRKEEEARKQEEKRMRRLEREQRMVEQAEFNKNITERLAKLEAAKNTPK